MFENANQKKEKNNVYKVIGIVIYLLTFIYRDANSIVAMLSMYAILLFFPFDKNEIENHNRKNFAITLYVAILVIFEFICSYIIRLQYKELFFIGSIKIFGIEIMNSFVVTIQIISILIYYVFLNRKKIFDINKKIIFLIVIISIPFILTDLISAGYKVFIEKINVDRLLYFNLAYRAFILAALLEELFYRGMIYDELKKICPKKCAQIVQALLFTLVHSERWLMLFNNFDLNVLINLILVFLMGILSSKLRDKSNSLLPSVIMHGALNGGFYNLIISLLSI